MLKTILAASVIALASAASASAASPVSPATASGILNADRAQSSVIDVQWHSSRESRRHPHRHHSHRYVPGRHYRSAPRGWHRHASRPWDWQRRGCVVVGAIWFCP